MIHIELKLCPFCRGKAVFRYEPGSWGYYPAKYSVYCTACGVSTPSVDDKEEVRSKGKPTSADDAQRQAAAIWNRRVVESEA